MLLRCLGSKNPLSRAYDASLARYRRIDGGRTAGSRPAEGYDEGNNGKIGRKTAQGSHNRLQNGYTHYWRMSMAMVKVRVSRW